MSVSIEEYDFSQELGRGGFGVVYRAKHRATGKDVAIKIINKRAVREQNLMGKVENEIRVHRKLRHENIVQCLGCAENDENIFIVLELCTRGNLLTYLQQRGKLPESEAVQIIQQLLSALCYIHSLGVIHRDLKLANILLTGDIHKGWSAGLIKLCDFGLAAQREHPDEDNMTMCGTANYMSPEVTRSLPHSYPADIWSVGCLFYTLVVGRPPFDTGNFQATIERAWEGEYTVPEGYFSEEGRQLLKDLLKKDQSQRLNVRQILQHPLLLASPCTSPLPQYNSSSSGAGLGRGGSGGSGRRLQAVTEVLSVSGEGVDLQHSEHDQQKAQWFVVRSPPPSSLDERSKGTFNSVYGGAEGIIQGKSVSAQDYVRTSFPSSSGGGGGGARLAANAHQGPPGQAPGPPRIREAHVVNLNQQQFQYLYAAQPVHPLHAQPSPTSATNASTVTASTALVSYPHLSYPERHRQQPLQTRSERDSGVRANAGTAATSGQAAVPPPPVVPQDMRANNRTQSEERKTNELAAPTLSPTEPTPAPRRTPPQPSPPYHHTTSTQAARFSAEKPSAHPNGRDNEDSGKQQASTGAGSLGHAVFASNDDVRLLLFGEGYSSNDRAGSTAASMQQRTLHHTPHGGQAVPRNSVQFQKVHSVPEVYLRGEGQKASTTLLHTPSAHQVHRTAGDRRVAQEHHRVQYANWSTQYVHDRFLGPGLLPSGPVREGRVVPTPSAPPSSGAPTLTVQECLAQVVHDLADLPPICLSTHGGDLFVVSTVGSQENSARELVLVSPVEARTTPPRSSGGSAGSAGHRKYVRVVVRTSDPHSVVLGQVCGEGRAEYDRLLGDVAVAAAEEERNRLIQDLQEPVWVLRGPLPGEGYSGLGVGNVRASTDVSGGGADAIGGDRREGAIKGVLRHDSYNSGNLTLLRTAETDTRKYTVSSCDSGTAQLAVPPLVHALVKKVHDLIAALKGRLPRRIFYFTSPPSTAATTAADQSAPSMSARPGKSLDEYKCMFMSNTPYADFYVQWRDGAALRYEPATGRLHVDLGPAVRPAMKWSGDLAGVESSVSLSGSYCRGSRSSGGGSAGMLAGIIPAHFLAHVRVALRAYARCSAEKGSGNSRSGKCDVVVMPAHEV